MTMQRWLQIRDGMDFARRGALSSEDSLTQLRQLEASFSGIIGPLAYDAKASVVIDDNHLRSRSERMGTEMELVRKNNKGKRKFGESSDVMRDGLRLGYIRRCPASSRGHSGFHLRRTRPSVRRNRGEHRIPPPEQCDATRAEERCCAVRACLTSGPRLHYIGAH